MAEDSAERDRWTSLLAERAQASTRSRTVALVYSIALGWLGADRFYLGYPGLGLLKLCTLGGFGLWWLTDIILLSFNGMKDADGGRLDGRFRH